ncbi:MAG: acyltransferase [Micavibrio sp.]|nr:acyltransferase [Micavibrio sp.]
MPSAIKRFIYNKFLGCDIHPTAKIGFSYVHAQKIVMGAHSKIGHLNIIRNLELFEIGESSVLKYKNCISALPLGSDKHFRHNTDRNPSFILGGHASIVKGHYFDCCDQIKIGNYVTLAGHGTSFFTHGINIDENRQDCAPIKIGHYCMIGSCCVITKGAVLPDQSLLAVGSVLHKPFTESFTLYSGVPAKAVKALNPEGKFFHREYGYVP